MEQNVKEQLEFIKDQLKNGVELENTFFLNEYLIEELNKEKLEKRNKKSKIGYAVGQAFYGSLNLIFTGSTEINDSKNNIEVKGYYGAKKFLAPLLLGGVISAFSIKTGITLYDMIAYIGKSIPYIFNSIIEPIQFNYFEDIKKISDKIMTNIVPNISEDIKNLKGFIKSKEYIFENITNGVLGFLGLYYTSKTNKIGVIDELLNINIKMRKKNDYEDYKIFKMMKNDTVFLSEYLFRFNLMYDVLGKKLKKMKVTTQDFLYDFAKKIFSDVNLFKKVSIEESGVEEKLLVDNNFRALYNAFQNYIVNLEDLKNYDYNEKLKIFKKIIEKTEKETEKEVVKSILYSSIVSLSSKNLFLKMEEYINIELYENFDDNILYSKEEQKEGIKEKYKQKNKIIKELELEKEFIKNNLKNLIMISKIDDYASNKDKTSHLFEFSEIAKMALDLIKNKQNLNILLGFSLEDSKTVENFLKEKINKEIKNKKDEELISKTIDKKQKVNHFGNFYSEAFMEPKTFNKIFFNTLIEVISEEKKLLKEKENKINELMEMNFKKENYLLDSYKNTNFNCDIDFNLLQLSNLIFKYDQRNGTDKYYKNVTINKITKNYCDLNSLINYQINYFDTILNIIKDKKNINIENLNLEDKKKLMIDFLEENKKEIFDNIDEYSKKYIELRNSSEENIGKKNFNLSEIVIKENVLQFILEIYFPILFEEYEEEEELINNIETLETNLSTKRLLDIFFSAITLIRYSDMIIEYNDKLEDYYDINYSLQSLFFEFKGLSPNEVKLSFQKILNIEEKDLKYYYDYLMDSHILNKFLIKEFIRDFKKNLYDYEEELRINNYIIHKLKNNDFALFNDINQNLIINKTPLEYEITFDFPTEGLEYPMRYLQELLIYCYKIPKLKEELSLLKGISQHELLEIMEKIPFEEIKNKEKEDTNKIIEFLSDKLIITNVKEDTNIFKKVINKIRKKN